MVSFYRIINAGLLVGHPYREVYYPRPRLWNLRLIKRMG